MSAYNNEIDGANKHTCALSLEIDLNMQKLHLHRSSNSSNASDDDTKSTPGPVTVTSTTLTLQSTTSTLSSGSLTPCSTPTLQQPIVLMINPEEREEMARAFIKKRKLSFTYDELNPGGQKRVKRLLTPDYAWSPNKYDGAPLRGETTFRDEFEVFCENSLEAKAWNDLSRVFFDDPAMEQYLVIRRQRAGICFMHAGALWQHYLQCIRTPGLADHKMLDLSTFIRDRFSNHELENFLKNGGGGSSVSFFYRITGIPVDKLSSRSFEVRKSQDPDYFNVCTAWALQTYARLREPGLVSDFRIELDFIEGNKSVYDVAVAEENFYSYAQLTGRDIPVRHSMVLIGVHRDEETGKVWFLLQNFWSNKYFCLVSAEYMASCKARISFVEHGGDVSLKEKYKTVDAMFVETDLKVEEGEELEGDEWADLDSSWTVS